MCCKRCNFNEPIITNVSADDTFSATVYYFSRHSHLPDRRIKTKLAFYELSHYINENLISITYSNGLVIKLFTN